MKRVPLLVLRVLIGVAAISDSGAQAPTFGAAAEALAHPERFVEPADVDAQRAIQSLSAEDRAAIASIAEHTASAVEAERTAILPGTPPPRAQAPATYQLFLSQSMADAELREAFALARERPELTLVFRGPRKRQTMAQLMGWIRAHLGPAAGSAAIARVTIDPPAFTRFSINAAPTLVRVDADGSVAKVKGLLNPEWLAKRAAEDPRAEFGVQGRLSEIAELDLMVLMQERATALDWAQMKRQALNRHIQHIASGALPAATQDRTRRLDPSFVVSEEIRGADGTLIAFPGMKVNPLRLHPFTQRLVVFDGTQPAQVAFARQLIDEVRGTRRVTALVAGLDADGAAHLERLRNALDLPVFLLDASVRERFELVAAPTTVEADGQDFIVTEFLLPPATTP